MPFKFIHLDSVLAIQRDYAILKRRKEDAFLTNTIWCFIECALLKDKWKMSTKCNKRMRWMEMLRIRINWNESNIIIWFSTFIPIISYPKYSTIKLPIYNFQAFLLNISLINSSFHWFYLKVDSHLYKNRGSNSKNINFKLEPLLTPREWLSSFKALSYEVLSNID